MPPNRPQRPHGHPVDKFMTTILLPTTTRMRAIVTEIPILVPPKEGIPFQFHHDIILFFRVVISHGTSRHGRERSRPAEGRMKGIQRRHAAAGCQVRDGFAPLSRRRGGRRRRNSVVDDDRIRIDRMCFAVVVRWTAWRRRRSRDDGGGGGRRRNSRRNPRFESVIRSGGGVDIVTFVRRRIVHRVA